MKGERNGEAEAMEESKEGEAGEALQLPKTNKRPLHAHAHAHAHVIQNWRLFKIRAIIRDLRPLFIHVRIYVCMLCSYYHHLSSSNVINNSFHLSSFSSLLVTPIHPSLLHYYTYILFSSIFFLI